MNMLQGPTVLHKIMWCYETSDHTNSDDLIGG